MNHGVLFIVNRFLCVHETKSFLFEKKNNTKITKEEEGRGGGEKEKKGKKIKEIKRDRHLKPIE